MRPLMTKTAPRRDSHQMISPEYHLIVSEGTKTEPAYFEKIKETIDKKYRDRIHLDISGKGYNTVSLFNRAVQDVSLSSNVYKHVWLVYDKDDFPPENFDRTAELCAAASTDETRYHPIWSNQCIELWFLLHFMFLQADLHRDEYLPKLTECLKAAEKLEQINQSRNPSKCAPGTMVHRLIKTLKPYL